MINTLELRNENPVHLTLFPVINEYNIFINNNKIYKDSYNALFNNNNTRLINLFLHQRKSDMTVQSINMINKYEYAYLAIGINPQILYFIHF